MRYQSSIVWTCVASLFLALNVFFPYTGHALEVTFEEDAQLPIVNINVAIKAGAVTDPVGQAGLTNFTGEMLLRGSKLHTKQQIDLALDQMGARLDVETRAESLIFRGAVLTSQLTKYLGLLKEILTQPSFAAHEINKLKSEIISGLQEELGHDSSLAARKFNQFLFRDHPYGKPILGNLKDIESLSKSQVVAQYERLIRDRFLLIVGSGDASRQIITAWAKEVSSARPDTPLKPEEQALLEKVKTPKNAEHRRLLIIDKPERTQTQINMGQIGVLMTDKRFFPLHLGNHAFGGSSFSSILMTEVRVKRGWSYGANSYFRFGLEPRSWLVHLFPASKDTASALTLSIKLIEDLKNNGITEQQFEFAKQGLVKKSGFMFNTPKKRVENTLLEKTLNLPEGFMKSYGPELQKVSFSDVNRALKDFLKPENLAISVLGTAKDLKEALAKAAGTPGNQVEVVSYTAD
jgi:zinc protease